VHDDRRVLGIVAASLGIEEDRRRKSAALVAGAKVPVILPSRTDPPQTKAHSIALASLLKGQKVAA